ncbi:MAG: TetR family transcriptional regulator [Acidobacteria bacterium]|nr:TetR family transcriptional regulator [Acidobacteriota bacterium]
MSERHPEADPAATSGGLVSGPDGAEAERTETEERIFEAALRVFARKGRDGARMQEIADEAAINKAMLHYYFRSKDRLYAQVFHYVFHRFDRAFFEAVERAGEDSFAAALESFVDHYIDFIGHHLDVLKLMVNEFLDGGAVIRHEVTAMIATGQAPPQRFARLIARAVEAGEIAPVDPRHFLVTLVSGCLFPLIAFPMVSTLIPEAVDDYEGFLEARKKNLLDVLRRGIEPRSG